MGGDVCDTPKHVTHARGGVSKSIAESYRPYFFVCLNLVINDKQPDSESKLKHQLESYFPAVSGQLSSTIIHNGRSLISLYFYKLVSYNCRYNHQEIQSFRHRVG